MSDLNSQLNKPIRFDLTEKTSLNKVNVIDLNSISGVYNQAFKFEYLVELNKCLDI